MNVTEHFTLAELTRSPTAKKYGIDNSPTPEHIENMRAVCEKILEPVRTHFGKPVTINSSYRSPALNKRIGGATKSQHCNGEAVDFEINGISNKVVADWIGDNLEFDQVILEFWAPGGDPNAGWVHASIKRNGQNRNQKLIAKKTGGKTTYTAVNDFDPSTAKGAAKKLLQTAVAPSNNCPHCGQPMPQQAAAPAPRATTAAPKVTGETNPIKILQIKGGVTPDGVWGPNTFKAATRALNLTPTRAAHFFAQCAHESGNFKTFSENLNYSADGLNKIFPKYFRNAGRNAQQYHRQPEKIANVVYASRMGNGDTASGDGWKFRGRGAIQLTGKNNYTAFAQWAKRPDILTNPDIVATELAFESAMWFFESNGLWSICDQGFNDAIITKLTRRINGGTHGLDDRLKKTKQFAAWG